MKWDDRLVAKATARAEGRVDERRKRIRAAIAAEAPWIDAEAESGMVRLRAKGLFRALLDRPVLRAALRGWV